jgi:hypothetical protein
MRRRRPEDLHRWLAGQPSLDELSRAFPAEWDQVRRDLHQVLGDGDAESIAGYISALSRPVPRGGHTHGARRSDAQALLSEQVRRHISVALLRQMRLQAATGITDGTIRFNLLNGWVAQKLLFARELERKPVAMGLFRLVWPLLGQKRLLMPLVERKGIYSFYSKPLITQLASMVGDRSCLEIAAGDGTLARFLAARGVRITATDDHSWSQTVSYPTTVLRQDARTALRRHQPQVVFCAWPPAGNTFERHVFRTPGVELYVVIGSRAEKNSGNWSDYRRQSDFALTEDRALSRLVLPPEIRAAVYLFRRKRPGTGFQSGH